MQFKSETKFPNTTIFITLTTAKEMYDFGEVTHEHSEYGTEWGDLLYSLDEYQGIDSHIAVQHLPTVEQPKNGDVKYSIHLWCKDYDKLDYLEAEITKRIKKAMA